MWSTRQYPEAERQGRPPACPPDPPPRQWWRPRPPPPHPSQPCATHRSPRLTCSRVKRYAAGKDESSDHASVASQDLREPALVLSQFGDLPLLVGSGVDGPLDHTGAVSHRAAVYV